MANTLDTSKGAKPLYMQVKESLLRSITDGEWKENELIPPEVELQKRFSVSRITVRQAINELVNERRLARKSGVGTRVLAVSPSTDKFSTLVKSFSNEVQEIGIYPETYVIKLKKVTPDEKVRLVFGENATRKTCYLLSRVRGYENRKIVFFETYLCTDLELKPEEIDKTFSLYSTFRDGGAPLKIIEETISASKADKRVSARLGVEEGAAILVRERYGVDPKGEVTEYTKGYYNSELYTVRISIMGEK